MLTVFSLCAYVKIRGVNGDEDDKDDDPDDDEDDSFSGKSPLKTYFVHKESSETYSVLIG